MRVVLSPGNDGHCGMVRRIRAQNRGVGVHVMLDYDDFNSAHSTRAMQIVVEELVRATGYDEIAGAILVQSFEKEIMVYKGTEVGRVQGTLMSGHRMTTFINSVLNAAYIRCALGRQAYSRCASLHVGDDVYMNVSELDLVTKIVVTLRERGCRMNRMKQSIGIYGTEFLRVATRGRDSFGYLARSVSACISGNWVTEYKLDARESLNTMISHAVTMANRSIHTFDYGRVLARSVLRSTGLKTKRKEMLVELLRGDAAIDGGPCYNRFATHRSIQLKIKINKEYEERLKLLPAMAVDDYLAEGIQDIERCGLKLSNFDPHTVMKDSSYRKGLLYRDKGDDLRVEEVDIVRRGCSETEGSMNLAEAIAIDTEVGALARYPLLNFLKGHLKMEHINELMVMVGEKGSLDKEELYNRAWGVNSEGVVIEGVLSYTDARSLGRKARRCVVYMTENYWI